jgi:predicted metal-binding membrane protein
MPMPGGWTMSMAWTPMCGQTWRGAAASFLIMWVVMMVTMMLPSLMPALWRYRRAVGVTGGMRLAWLTALVAAGCFFVWTACGMTVFPLGVALAAIEMRLPSLARAIPIAAGGVVRSAGVLQFTTRKARQLACCRAARRRGRSFRADFWMIWAARPAPRPPLRHLLCRPNGDPPRYRNHGPARDGCRDGGHHRRASHAGR